MTVSFVLEMVQFIRCGKEVETCFIRPVTYSESGGVTTTDFPKSYKDVITYHFILLYIGIR